MQRFVLRRLAQSVVSVERAIGIVRAFPGASIIASNGLTLLIDFDAGQLDLLRGKLSGWLIAPQGRPIPVPGTHLHIKQQ